MNNKLQTLIELKKQLKNKTRNQLIVLNELQELINSEGETVSEFAVYHELNKLIKIRREKARRTAVIKTLNDNSNDIIEFLSLNEEQFKKVKNFGQELLTL